MPMNSEYQTLFDQATQLQSDAQWDAALDRYQQIKSNGLTSPSVEFNLALVYAEKEDWGRSLQSISEGQKLARRPWLANELQEKIETKVPSGRGHLSAGFWSPVLYSEAVIHREEGFFLAILLLGFSVIQFARGKKDKITFSLLAWFLFFLLLSGLQHLAPKESYVINDSDLKTLPLPNAPVKVALSKGTHVLIDHCTKDYCQVERPGDISGWIDSSAFDDQTTGQDSSASKE